MQPFWSSDVSSFLCLQNFIHLLPSLYPNFVIFAYAPYILVPSSKYQNQKEGLQNPKLTIILQQILGSPSKLLSETHF